MGVISVLVLPGTVTGANTTSRHRGQLVGCMPRHSHLIAADARGQVFLAPEPDEGGAEAVYGCVYGKRRSYFLGKIADCGSSGCAGVEHETIAGTIVAYEEFSVSMNEHRWYVVARDLKNGHILHKIPTGTPRGASPSEGLLVGVGPAVAIVVRDNGDLAWATENEIGLADAPTNYEIHVIEAGGSRLLAAGVDIVPRSLALAASTLYWTQGGKPFSATLN